MSIFSTVPVNHPKTSTFRIHHEHATSFKFGDLNPILCKTVLPGDTWSVNISDFIRTMALISPVMARNDVKVDAFFVPWRLIWDDVDKWLALDPDIHMPQVYWDNDDLQKTGTDLSTFHDILGKHSLALRLGFGYIPISQFPAGQNTGTVDVSGRKLCALPFRAYNLIYNYYFRNKNFESELTVDTDSLDHDDLDTDFFVRQRPWRRDVFTSAQPTPQKGDPVLMPTGDIIPKDSDPLQFQTRAKTPIADDVAIKSSTGQSGFPSGVLATDSGPGGAGSTGISYKSGLSIDSPTLEDLRYAETLEEFLEAESRTGAAGIGRTLKEWLFAIWGVKSSDSRLDRPEYLGGYRGPITISEVPQTSGTSSVSPQGNLAGKGVSAGGSRLFRKKYFEEPGYIMVLMSLVPKTVYFEGDPREFLYDTGFDFPNPFFANLGEQEIFQREIKASHQVNPNTYENNVFGYNVRNYEMKSFPDRISGSLVDDLLFWTEARKFGTAVTNLNPNFCHMLAGEANRIFAVSGDSDKFIGEFFFDIKLKRRLPYYGIPRFGHTGH